MERPILFRGKSIYTNKYIHGYLTSNDSINDVECHPDTIGQFTGKKDINGIDIYEGDVDTKGGVIMFYNSAFQVCSVKDNIVLQVIPLWCFDNNTFNEIEIKK